MKTHKDFKAGQTIEVTYIKWPEYKDTYFIERTDMKDEGQGTIEMSVLKRISPRAMPIKYERKDRITVVEEQWFDEDLTGRRIKTV